jgi:putative ABC transport system permease protein
MARGRGGGSGFDAIPYSAVFLANMAALFLLLSTLAMNVQSQRRELAVLRAIGAPAWMPAMAVLLQGLGLAVAGWVIGAACGLHGFREGLPEAARAWGHVLSLARGGLWLSALPVLVATLLACLPAVWMVVRLHPLEDASPASAQAGRVAIAWGLAALALHPFLAWTPLARGPLAQSLVLPAAYLLGMAGAILMVPGILRALARLLARPLGALLGLHPLLLRDHNQSGLWQQTLGAAALVVSLAFYLTTAIWGESMRKPFVVGEKVQDAIAMFLPNGPLAERSGEVAALPGVVSDSAMRLTHLQLAATDALGGKFFAGSGEIILIRADLEKFLDGIGHRVVAGRTGPLGAGECVVMDQMPITDPDAFRLGKPFGVYPLEDDSEEAGAPAIDRARSELVPVGVLDIPGWQLITKSTRMRRGMNRSLSLAFVNDATFDRYAPHVRENCHWLSLAPGTSMQELQDGLNGLRPFPAAYVKLTDIAATQDMINRRSDSVIAPLLRLPLMVLGLSSLAVLVSLVAAAWSRRRAYALLDALGLTRVQLVRLLLGEAILLALAAVLLGTLLALLFARTGILLCNRMMSVHAPYIFPWNAFATGAAATLGATLLASLLAIPVLYRRSGPASALSGADRS